MVTPSITVSEDVGFVEVCFSLSRQSAVPIDVRVDGRDGTAIGKYCIVFDHSHINGSVSQNHAILKKAMPSLPLHLLKFGFNP